MSKKEIRIICVISVLGLALIPASIIAQTPAPTPPDKRGLGIQSSGETTNKQTTAQSREAKPELVLQTGHNFFGATRLVFSPDGKLLATGTYRSNTVKLWETATNRKLRDLAGGGQTTPGIVPAIAFSRDNRLVASSAGDNSVKVWDVMSGRELYTLAGVQGSMMASIGVYFIGFASDNRLVTISDAIRVWDLSTGRELRSPNASSSDSVSAPAIGNKRSAIRARRSRAVLSPPAICHKRFAICARR